MKITVLGGGESGVGAALLAKRLGEDVFVSDAGALREECRAELRGTGIEFEEGGHTWERILCAAEVIKSPGIPDSAPLVRELKAQGVPVVSEIEYAGRHTNAKMLCVTGSNGKTTTTLLAHHLLTSAGIDARLAGNVGLSLARQVAEPKQPACYVVELSSFQLDGMFKFHPNIAILTNITPDHLDRYDHKFENYARSKFRIAQNLTADDLFIFNSDDPATREFWPKTTIAAKCCGVGKASLLPPDKISLPGLHNQYNATMAAMAATEIVSQSIAQGLLSFANAPHRLERVGAIDGAEYINDSKATNVDSAHYALNAQTKPVVWIAGGTDKGNDYSTLYPDVDGRVKALVCLGVDNKKLIDSFAGHIPTITEARSIAECLEKCRALAAPGDVVLLSPCCASFDLFKNYEDRGNQFRAAVAEAAAKWDSATNAIATTSNNRQSHEHA